MTRIKKNKWVYGITAAIKLTGISWFFRIDGEIESNGR